MQCEHRENLACVFALIDSGLAPQRIDLEFVEWLISKSIPFVIVFTKTDRGTPEAVRANMAAFTAAIASWFVKLPEFFSCSSTTGQGRSELLGVIAATIAAEPTASKPKPPVAPLPPEIEPPFRLQVRAGNLREEQRPAKKGPGSARPW